MSLRDPVLGSVLIDEAAMQSAKEKSLWLRSLVEAKSEELD
jgi:hypothetical protein